MELKVGTRSVFLTAVLVVVLGIAGGIVYATIPDGSGVIHGCYGTTGALRVIDDSAACRTSETPLNWSVTGPQGPPGPAGAATEAFAADSGLNPIGLPDTLVTLLLPAGDYVLSGKAVVINEENQTAQLVCLLQNGGELGGPTILDQSATYLFPGATLPTPAGSIATLPLVGRVSLAGQGMATIGIFCIANVPSASAQFASVYAIRVATLSQQ